MPAPRECPHTNFAANVAVNRLEDTGRFHADVTITCTQCGVAFRGLGLQPGIAWDRPTCNITGETLQFPIEPAYERQLFDGARFEMPPLKERSH